MKKFLIIILKVLMILTFVTAMIVIAIIFGKLMFDDLKWLYIGIGVVPAIIAVSSIIITKLSDIITDIEFEEEWKKKQQKNYIKGYPTRRRKP